MPTTAARHRIDTGRNARRRPYVLGGPKCFVRYIFWGRAQQGPFSASGAIECRLREVLRVKTWCRRSRCRDSHLTRGPGEYGGHRRRSRCHPGFGGAGADILFSWVGNMAPFCTPGSTSTNAAVVVKRTFYRVLRGSHVWFSNHTSYVAGCKPRSWNLCSRRNWRRDS